MSEYDPLEKQEHVTSSPVKPPSKKHKTFNWWIVSTMFFAFLTILFTFEILGITEIIKPNPKVNVVQILTNRPKCTSQNQVIRQQKNPSSIYSFEDKTSDDQITKPLDVYHFLNNKKFFSKPLSEKTHEEFHVLLLDDEGKILNKNETLNSGVGQNKKPSANEVLIDAKKIEQQFEDYRGKTNKAIFVHNHPSNGWGYPSLPDIKSYLIDTKDRKSLSTIAKDKKIDQTEDIIIGSQEMSSLHLASVICLPQT